MAVVHGSNNPINGVQLLYDPGNRFSAIQPGSSLIDTSAWAEGQTGGVGIYQGNTNSGTNSENARVMAYGPFGTPCVVWETRCSGDYEADGGWNTDYIPVDSSKLYRFSVWMRIANYNPDVGFHGNFYFGTQSNMGNVTQSNGDLNGNPYWSYAGVGNLPETVGQNWMLWVGHCYPVGTSFSGYHPNSGVYYPNYRHPFITFDGRYYANPSAGVVYSGMGNNVGSADMRWTPGTTHTYFRVYHYYSTDSTTRLQFAYPRIEVCDGTELPMISLTARNPKAIQDISFNDYTQNFIGRHAVSEWERWRVAYPKADLIVDPLASNTPFASNTATSNTVLPTNGTNKTGAYSYPGTVDFDNDGSYWYTQLNIKGIDLKRQPHTIIAAMRYTPGTNQRLVTSAHNNWLMGAWGDSTENYYAEGWVSPAYNGDSDANWRIIAATCDPISDNYQLYVNGQLVVENNEGSSGPAGLSFGKMSNMISLMPSYNYDSEYYYLGYGDWSGRSGTWAPPFALASGLTITDCEQWWYAGRLPGSTNVYADGPYTEVYFVFTVSGFDSNPGSSWLQAVSGNNSTLYNRTATAEDEWSGVVNYSWNATTKKATWTWFKNDGSYFFNVTRRNSGYIGPGHGPDDQGSGAWADAAYWGYTVNLHVYTADDTWRGEASNGEIGHVQIHPSVLSADHIKQHFESMRSRYGL